MLAPALVRVTLLLERTLPFPRSNPSVKPHDLDAGSMTYGDRIPMPVPIIDVHTGIRMLGYPNLGHANTNLM